MKATVEPAWTGLFVMLAGIFIAGYGIYPGRNDTVWDYGMVITLIGVVLLCCGWQVMKVAWFPLFFLFAAIPFPGLIYSKMAMPLQNIAAKVAVFTLQLTGVTAQVSGTKIHMGDGIMSPFRTLNVAEACAGLRSLMTFISIAAAVAFLSSRPLWQKIFITVSAVPIAISCNVMRVAGQGLLDHYVSQEMSDGFAHQFVGLAMLVPAFFLILLVGWLLDKIFVEEVDDSDQETPKRRAAKRVGKGYREVAKQASASATAPATASASAQEGA
jgi:exosortase